MNLFIDCEFNSYKGELISMALVSEDGVQEFYEVVQIPDQVDPWVAEHVVPILDRNAIGMTAFQRKLKVFLNKFPAINIIADYPDDIKYFMESVITGPGEWFKTQPLTCVVDDALSAKASASLHNALEYARAIRLSWFANQGIQP